MIITIKLKLKNNIDFGIFQKKYTNVVRFAFNRTLDNLSKFDIFKLLNNLNNVDELDLTWKREAAKLGYSLGKATVAKFKESNNPGDLKVIFGGKKLFYQRLKGKITKEEYIKLKKLQPITCEGSKSDNHGNRKFKFDFSTFDGSVKLGDDIISFSCHKTSKRNIILLSELENLILNKEIGVTYKINSEYFYIIFDLDRLPNEISYKKDKECTLGIDMNPNYIAISIIKDDTIVLRKCYDLSLIKSNNNKRKYEIIQIVLDIKQLCINHNVSYVGYEKLNIKSNNKGKGKRFNKQVNNEWCREYFINSLQKHLTLIGCKYTEIVAEYSSFIGQLMNPNDTDSIAASIEINRRLRKYKRQYIDKTEQRGSVVYPKFSSDYLNRWKKDGNQIDEIKDWREAYLYIKKSKHSYRFLYKDYVKRNCIKVFRLKCDKSLVRYIINEDKIPYFN